MLQTTTIADKDIRWVDKGKEILVDGKMFDIESARHLNDTTTFCGLYDDDETLLIIQMDEKWNENSSGDHQFLGQLFECFHNIFCNQLCLVLK